MKIKKIMKKEPRRKDMLKEVFFTFKLTVAFEK